MAQQPLAYLDPEFLESHEARPIRILSEGPGEDQGRQQHPAGAGEAAHLAAAFEVGAEAAIVASIVHERPKRLPELKAELREAGWNVRI